MIDVLDPHEECSLAEYVIAAETACRDIVARGRKPLFVGGTGLYLRGVLRGVFEGPAADWDLRRELDQIAAASVGVRSSPKSPVITPNRMHLLEMPRIRGRTSRV